MLRLSKHENPFFSTLLEKLETIDKASEHSSRNIAKNVSSRRNSIVHEDLREFHSERKCEGGYRGAQQFPPR